MMKKATLLDRIEKIKNIKKGYEESAVKYFTTISALENMNDAIFYSNPFFEETYKDATELYNLCVGAVKDMDKQLATIEMLLAKVDRMVDSLIGDYE